MASAVSFSFMASSMTCLALDEDFVVPFFFFELCLDFFFFFLLLVVGDLRALLLVEDVAAAPPAGTPSNKGILSVS